MPSFIKDPDAILDYEVDWSAWLEDGDAIDTSTWIVESGVDVDDEAVTDTTATVWLSGGTLGSTYKATNRITTFDGRTDDRTITISVRNR